MVLDGYGDSIRKYTWGLDLSGTIHGAGGIGGLLAVEETAAQGSPGYWFFYDGNGNVGQIMYVDNLSGDPAAKYEYDPYGNIIGPDHDADGDWRDDAGPYALANPFRFSTKCFDDETGLGYWGHRYYSSRLGRWISRDPIGELAELNVYAFVVNIPTCAFDWNGLKTCQNKTCSVTLTVIENISVDSVKKEGSITCLAIKDDAVKQEVRKQLESKGGRDPIQSDFDCQGEGYDYDKHCFCKCVVDTTSQSGPSTMPFTINTTKLGCRITATGTFTLTVYTWGGTCRKAG